MNVIQFPLQKSDTDRVRLHRDEPCTILVLPSVRTGHEANRFGRSAEQSQQT